MLKNSIARTKKSKGSRSYKSASIIFYAQIKVRMEATKVKTNEMGSTILITLDSTPILSIVAAAFCSFAGEITLARPAAIAVPAVTIKGLTLSISEVIILYFVKRAMADASLPLTKPPSKPRKAATPGYKPWKKLAELTARMEIILKSGADKAHPCVEGAIGVNHNISNSKKNHCGKGRSGSTLPPFTHDIFPLRLAGFDKWHGQQCADYDPGICIPQHSSINRLASGNDLYRHGQIFGEEIVKRRPEVDDQTGDDQNCPGDSAFIKGMERSISFSCSVTQERSNNGLPPSFK